jgi:hypothetical protein
LSEDDQKPPLDAALRHLAEQQRRSLTSHPTPQELAAYHAGELSPEAEARILDHLAICRECSDLLLDLAGFADLKPPKGVPELTDQQVEQDWQKLRARMRAGEGGKEAERRTAEVVPIRPAGPAAKPERTYSPLLPIAASLLAVLGFSLAIYQGRQLGRLSQMQVNPPAIYLEGPTRGEGGGPAERTVAGQSFEAILSDIDVPEGASYSGYEVELRDEEGRVRQRTIYKGPLEEPMTILFRAGLPPGRYKINLYGIAEGQKDSLAEREFIVDGS